MINKKEEYFYCEIEEFNSEEKRYLTFSDWNNLCKNYESVKIIQDSFDKDILCSEIQNKNRVRLVRSELFYRIGLLMGIISAIYLLEFIVIKNNNNYNPFLNNEYNYQIFLLSGIACLFINFFNDPRNFTFENGWFAPGIIYDDNYYYRPLCYVTFFENFNNSYKEICENEFNKFKKEFYDYLK